MGKQMALGFAEAGADVVLADINLPGAEQTAGDIGSLGRRALAVQRNVSDIGKVRSLYKTIDAEFGRIDVVGNVAGEGLMGRPEELPVETLEEVMKNLVVGRITSCQEGGRRMLARGRGSIINCGSIGGWNSPGRGHTPYGIAMGAVIQMTRELSTEWASRGVRVNAILSAQVWNDGLRKRIASTPGLEETFTGGIQWGASATPRRSRDRDFPGV
jgi:NAD(P)-dependent dehydrogenase (short-subunit alcohol dehydrogenase family)